MPPDAIRVSYFEKSMWSFLLFVRRHSDSERESSSTAEKCPGGEQRIGGGPRLDSDTTAVLAALFRCFTHGPVSESSREWSSISADDLVLHDVHSSADEFCPVHLSVVVLLTRVASDSHW